jgi:hypothetical protein
MPAQDRNTPEDKLGEKLFGYLVEISDPEPIGQVVKSIMKSGLRHDLPAIKIAITIAVAKNTKLGDFGEIARKLIADKFKKEDVRERINGIMTDVLNSEIPIRG